jgi:hypothetical protein
MIGMAVFGFEMLVLFHNGTIRARKLDPWGPVLGRFSHLIQEFAELPCCYLMLGNIEVFHENFL